METDREWVKHCYITDCSTGERMTIDESISRTIDNAHIRAGLRELAERGVDFQRSRTSRPADISKLAKWAAEVVCKSNFAPDWLALGDSPGAALSRTDLMGILHRIAIEEATAAIVAASEIDALAARDGWRLSV
jgi:hypothetical protein